MIIKNNYLNGTIEASKGLNGQIGSTVKYINPKVQEKTVSPGTSIINVLPDDGYTGLSKVKINAVSHSIDPNIKPENIIDGITILGVLGTAKGNGGLSAEVEGTTLVFESLHQVLGDELVL